MTESPINNRTYPAQRVRSSTHVGRLGKAAHFSEADINICAPPAVMGP